jgi:GTP-binding protein
LKKIAIIGKPNVGKSSLFNRVARERDAIISEVSGTTRDVKRRVIKIDDTEALLFDTGGFDTSSELFQSVSEKSMKSAKEADVILYMVDGREIPDDEDRKRFFRLQKANPNIALVINKLDNDKLEEVVWDYSVFGVDEIFPISISHNRKVNRLLNWVYDKISDKDNHIVPLDPDEDDDNERYIATKSDRGESEINVSIIGRVNVGKSSLLNALTKSDRAVVSPIAGTTIDPIDEVVEVDNRKIRFVDTAGIRRRGRIEGIERYALMRTEGMLERSHIAIIVLDSTEDFKELDEKIAGLVDKHHLGAIIVLNKWDKREYEYKEAVQIVRDKFKFLYFAPIITLSALTHLRVHKLYDEIFRIYENYTRRVTTSQLNSVIENAVLAHSLPAPKGRVLKIYFSTQYDVSPPRVALVMNRPKLLHFSYRRYLINKLREAFDFEGSPVLISTRGKKKSKREDSTYTPDGEMDIPEEFDYTDIEDNDISDQE